MFDTFIKGSSVLTPNSIGLEKLPGNRLEDYFKEEKQKVDINVDLVGKRLGFTGFKRLPRETKLACYAIEQVLENSGTPIPKQKCNQTAVIIASTFSNLNPIVELYNDVEKFGADKLNPAIFPNTVINSISGYASIMFNITGPNITISQGKFSGLKALEFSLDLLQKQLVENVVICELNLQPPQLFHGLISRHVQKESIASLLLSTHPSKNTIIMDKNPKLIDIKAENKLNSSFAILELLYLLKQKTHIYLKKSSDANCFVCEDGDDIAR
ncbi:beta-ketoacyl synthase N-terminal-like domain-containing protein [Chengkuizengella sediminis]|uniref:beta-ketoacyl synthase N-terminal-like domain-containing protein n=1 Tax=Chengkuizengella sediminis TaxID=1885917 RepID=UPI001389E182|nr:beta-ketoacyl synthase N-terminal-like domain-containing protein [Chengkuizengella sediminis]NDI35945.1 hypothetical protein [Chengkuizengella sediminis]